LALSLEYIPFPTAPLWLRPVSEESSPQMGNGGSKKRKLVFLVDGDARTCIADDKVKEKSQKFSKALHPTGSFSEHRGPLETCCNKCPQRKRYVFIIEQSAARRTTTERSRKTMEVRGAQMIEMLMFMQGSNGPTRKSRRI
jgi:hypothetical protein